MEDLLARLQEILGSEEGKQQLAQVAQMLGMEEGKASPAPDLSALSALAGGGKTPVPARENAGAEPPGIDLKMLAQAQKLLSTMQMEDDNTRLLRALRPHFSAERQQKVDRAIQMLHLFALLPVIQQSGLLGGLLGDAGKQI